LIALGHQLETMLRTEQRLARTDPVTELANGRAFYESLDRALLRARGDGDPVVLAYLDLDDFKIINDRFGHEAGDRVLRQVAAAISRSIREGDLAARLGRDEFVVLLRDTTPEALMAIATRLTDRIRVLEPPDGADPIGVSVGVAYMEQPPATAAEAIHAADQAMYRAKSRGKNSVEVTRD
jgi:diguanylate cyclase (GGDEF)-like protein